MSKVLVIGDIHEPVSHPKYMDFCLDLRRKYRTNKTVFIGDIIDNHAISFHAKHPELPGPSDEYELAFEKVQRWYKRFPKAVVLLGNHDLRVLRLAETVNIPSRFLRSHAEIWKTKNWEYEYEIILEGVNYYHGEGCGGINPAYNRAKSSSLSVCIGHAHSSAGVKWIVDKHARRFGLDTGTGIDVTKFQFAYGKHMPKRPVLSAAVILDGTPQHFIMECGPGEKYHRSKK